MSLSEAPALPFQRIAASSAEPRTPQDLRDLHYPFGRWVPDHGTLFEVAPGIHWTRMGLPFGLDHINLWVLDAGDGWAIVDTGVNLPASKRAWERLFAGPLAGKPVTRVIVTHYHPDHLGLAGWLCALWNVPLEIARTEYLLARSLILDVRDAPPPEAVDFSIRAGWPDTAVTEMRQKPWGNFHKIISPLPAGFKRIKDGDVLTIGARQWRVVTGRGHAPEHSCLVSDDVMIAGDQVLPRITSNVSVYPTEPFADPLADWLESIETLRAIDPGILVLPAHNEPFTGLHTRLDQLRADHVDKLAKLLAFCAEPRTAVDSFATLFRKPIGESDYGIATGEAVAHLHWLEERGQLRRITDALGVDRFVAI
ncbi:MBL fold metallo-hydrolase [Polymorphobacter fuscus]|uniref:MBL fold metallo-hydrolase n=2 Tax=Sandarakinorhabdus fusca TaxID=1439888 RepID=A0A7C9KYN7_9SPHN|nr:MBL fold metallo-hydrolase [Polymorphobacter fuscus]MQT18562.1 MBL fold metallo-hydrolase [Polymorphobacter fuscus]